MTEAPRRASHNLVSSKSGNHEPWWQTATVYQVYPRSFQDGGSDGVGDLVGVRSRLDYLQWLGIEAIWLSPIFRSPMADFGYDISDYRDVDPLFGTLPDLDALLEDAHRRGMKVLLDLVPNHTSDRHPWFVEARSSRSAGRRDWYIWRDPLPDGSPPNSWVSVFGGSAWEWDEATDQYYFHSFLKEQPDLNWRNPQVREAMFEVMRFWLRRGVDGFRIDVVNLLAKRYELLPTRAERAFAEQPWAASPAIYPLIRRLRKVADEFEDRVLIGEVWLPVRRLVKFYGSDLRGLHMPFNFQLITLDWSARAVHRAVERYEALLPTGAWPNWVLGNHDRERIATRVGLAQARVAVVLLLTLRGTPTIYYGDEIGMVDVPVPADRQRDPQGLRGGLSRDPQRTPMRWDASANAGFTSAAEPWLPMGDDLETVNVAVQRDDPGSMLTLYRRLLAVRREERALSVGAWHDLGATRSTIAFARSDGDQRFLVAANLTGRRAPMPPAVPGMNGRTIISTLSTAEVDFVSNRELEPNEALVVRLG